jgi:hypothetical protein
LQERVEQFRKTFEEHPPPPGNGGFGKRLKEAVKSRLAGRPRAFMASASASTDDDSFGKKLSDAIQKRLTSHPNTPKKGREQAERERARYRPVTRRQPTKSD